MRGRLVPKQTLVCDVSDCGGRMSWLWQSVSRKSIITEKVATLYYARAWIQWDLVFEKAMWRWEDGGSPPISSTTSAWNQRQPQQGADILTIAAAETNRHSALAI
jgi:hypothetical protein